MLSLYENHFDGFFSILFLDKVKSRTVRNFTYYGMYHVSQFSSNCIYKRFGAVLNTVSDRIFAIFTYSK